jgi:hypothetical protein
MNEKCFPWFHVNWFILVMMFPWDCWGLPSMFWNSPCIGSIGQGMCDAILLVRKVSYKCGGAWALLERWRMKTAMVGDLLTQPSLLASLLLSIKDKSHQGWKFKTCRQPWVVLFICVCVCVCVCVCARARACTQLWNWSWCLLPPL